MKTQIIALEAHDDFISVRDRMSWAKSPRILLVWPLSEKISLRAADLRILQQHAITLGAELGIITRRGDVRRDAGRFGIPVFASAAAAQREAWAPGTRLHKLPAHRKPRERAELEAMKAAALPPEAPWRSRPLSRLGFFALGVLAVLTIAGVFVPEATVTLTPVSQQQSVTLPINASRANRTVSITGSMPVHAITVAISSSQSARVATQSSIPEKKASGIARFTNLSQADVTIPKGTIVYSISPAAIQFATLNDTHLSGNVNAVVEVPIVAVKGGADANLPASAIQAIQGNLGLSAAVTNPKPTEGGTDRVTAAPSEADRQRLHDVVQQLVETQAESEIRESIGSKDLLLTETLKMDGVPEETYDPPAGQPGNLLKLTVRAQFTAEYLKAEDLKQLALMVLDSSKPEGFSAVDPSLTYDVSTTPEVDGAGTAHFALQLGRKLVQDIGAERANSMVRGLAPEAAATTLQTNLPLGGNPEIKLSPSWWPWMPLIPFRITVISKS